MKIIGTFGLAVAASFILMQSAEARGGARCSGAHYSAPHFSAPARSYPGPRQSFARNSARTNAMPRVSYVPQYQSYGASRFRYSPATTGFRNPAYVSGARQFAGNRTAAYNSRTFSRSNANLAPGNRTVANRSQFANQQRVIGRYNASSWHRNWDRGRDHNWRGHRCHYRNGFWFIYDPFPYWYPWGYYGYGYPYDGYYDSGYYDSGAYTQEETYPADTNRSEYAVDSQVSEVQSALAREGYYDGAIDGKLGPGTRNALIYS